MPNREMEGLYGEFHYHPVLQPEESHKQGREVYKDVLYLKIQIKGQKNQIRSRKATEQDKLDFPAAWLAFTKDEEEAISGTPLSAIPGVGPSLAMEIRQLGITSVEDLASLSDYAMDKFRGAVMFRERAKAYLAALRVAPEERPANKTTEEPPVDVEMLARDPSVMQKKRGRPPKDRTLQ